MPLFSEITQHRNQQYPFVAYRKPNEEILTVFFQTDTSLHFSDQLKESGFVFTSFCDDQRILFEERACVIKQQNIQHLVAESNFRIHETPSKEAKEFHVRLVEKGIEAIQTSDLEKVVLSRKEQVAVDKTEHLTYFQRLLTTYSNAFCYWWYHPEIGEWMGATPEQLVKKQGKTLTTVSLAGTQVAHDSDNISWGQKEQIEQKIVTDFIVESIKPYVKGIDVSRPYTFKAGQVMHLKTDITATLLQDSDFVKLVNAIHPTPALCGYPKAIAQQFIIENEGYDREFYGGYLGEINLNFTNYAPNSSDLFVNLRCMQLLADHAFLYLGGGVTDESHAESEWLETINKSQTIKKMI